MREYTVGGLFADVGIDKSEMKLFEHLKLNFSSKKILLKLNQKIVQNQIINLTKIASENNIAYGSKIRTGYAWKLKNVKKINLDKIINGKLGLWNIESY